MLRMYLEQNPRYHQASRLARNNSRGGLWLIGGTVFRTLAHLMYGTPLGHSPTGEATPKKVDFDFIVGSTPEALHIDSDWAIKTNSYGNRKFTFGEESIDVIPIATTSSVIRRKVVPTIENFLDGAPFTIQKIALNCLDWRLVDRGGIEALLNQEVKVNDLDEALTVSAKKCRPIPEIMVQLAHDLKFKCIGGDA
ncbi:MAG: hypothetical protein G01um10143_523 [Parcubacteria group bacterium Gr01-1014_3]|nr:MAG: hypothetical protein G01um10143_523 [Parcubacteria group bacterium Gr01-1014_3]